MSTRSFSVAGATCCTRVVHAVKCLLFISTAIVDSCFPSSRSADDTDIAFGRYCWCTSRSKYRKYCTVQQHHSASGTWDRQTRLTPHTSATIITAESTHRLCRRAAGPGVTVWLLLAASEPATFVVIRLSFVCTRTALVSEELRIVGRSVDVPGGNVDLMGSYVRLSQLVVVEVYCAISIFRVYVLCTKDITGN